MTTFLSQGPFFSCLSWILPAQFLASFFQQLFFLVFMWPKKMRRLLHLWCFCSGISNELFLVDDALCNVLLNTSDVLIQKPQSSNKKQSTTVCFLVKDRQWHTAKHYFERRSVRMGKKTTKLKTLFVLKCMSKNKIPNCFSENFVQSKELYILFNN